MRDFLGYMAVMSTIRQTPEWPCISVAGGDGDPIQELAYRVAERYFAAQWQHAHQARAGLTSMIASELKDEGWMIGPKRTVIEQRGSKTHNQNY